jgi:hypothetical protein
MSCREWRQKTAAAKTMTAFQAHFCEADLDRMSTATTATAGYHHATNHVTTALDNNQTPTNAQLIATAVQTQVATALAALQISPQPPVPHQPDNAHTAGLTEALETPDTTAKHAIGPPQDIKPLPQLPIKWEDRHVNSANHRKEGQLTTIQVDLT